MWTQFLYLIGTRKEHFLPCWHVSCRCWSCWSISKKVFTPCLDSEGPPLFSGCGPLPRSPGNCWDLQEKRQKSVMGAWGEEEARVPTALNLHTFTDMTSAVVSSVPSAPQPTASSVEVQFTSVYSCIPPYSLNHPVKPPVCCHLTPRHCACMKSHRGTS